MVLIQGGGKLPGNKKPDITDTPSADQVITFNSSKDQWDAQDAPGAGGGEANTASNVGTGSPIFKQKVGVDLEFETLIGGTGITLTDTVDDITISHDAHTGDVTGSTALTIANNAVDTAMIADSQVTNAKLADMVQNTIKGRVTASTGAPEDLTAANVRSIINVEDGANNYSHPNHTGEVTSTGDGATVLDPTAISAKALITTVDGTNDRLLVWDATDSALKEVAPDNLPAAGGGETNTASNVGTGVGVFDQKTGVDLEFNSLIGGNSIDVTDTIQDITIDMSDMAQNTIKGRVTASTGAPEDLTAANVRTIINVEDGANNYSHPNHTGDVTSTGDGATAIAAGAIVNADVNASAAIELSKLATDPLARANHTGTQTVSTISDLAADYAKAQISFVIDGGGSAITTGIKGDIPIGFDCTINEVNMYTDQTGSIVIDIWKDTHLNFPPTDVDSITASAVPTITTDDNSRDATLTGWTTSITEGDILRYNVDSITTVTRCTITLFVTKT